MVYYNVLINTTNPWRPIKLNILKSLKNIEYEPDNKLQKNLNYSAFQKRNLHKNGSGLFSQMKLKWTGSGRILLTINNGGECWYETAWGHEHSNKISSIETRCEYISTNICCRLVRSRRSSLSSKVNLDTEHIKMNGCTLVLAGGS